MNKKYTIAILLLATISLSSCNMDLGTRKQVDKKENTIVEVDKGEKTIEGANGELTEAQKKEKQKQEYEKKKITIKKQLEEKITNIKEIKSLGEIGDILMNKQLLSPENQKKLDTLIKDFSKKKSKTLVVTLKKAKSLNKKEKEKILEIANDIIKDTKMSPVEKSLNLEGLERTTIELDKRLTEYNKNPKKVADNIKKGISKQIVNEKTIGPITQMTGDLFNFVFEDNFKKVQNEVAPACINEAKETKKGIKKQIETNINGMLKQAQKDKGSILYMSYKDLITLHNGLKNQKIKINTFFNKIIDYDKETKEPIMVGGPVPYILYKGKKIDPMLIDYAYQVISLNKKYKLNIPGLNKIFFLKTNDIGIYGDSPYNYLLKDINTLIALQDEKLFCKIIENIYVKDKDYKKNMERFFNGDIEMDNIKSFANLQNVLQGLNGTF